MVRKKTAAAEALAAAAASGAAPAAAASAAAAAPPKAPADAAEGTQILEEAPEVFEAWKSLIGIGKPHPSPAVESGLLSSVPLPKLSGYDASGLPDIAVSEGKLSALQIESVLYAGRRHRLLIPAAIAPATAAAAAAAAAADASDGASGLQTQPQGGKRMVRAGFFLGDGTGIGKGRQIAAMILDNIARGRKKHVWISTSPDLKNEVAHDLADLGAPGVQVKDISDLDAACKGALGMDPQFARPATGLVLYITYTGLISARRVSVPKADGGGAGAAKSSQKQKRVDQLIEWLGEDWDGILCFDEAHRAKSYKVDKPSQTSKLSQAVLLLQESLPKARVVYASATGLQSLESMAYAQRLLLWGGSNHSFPSFNEFQAKFLKRGELSILELLAVEMKLSGAYTARSLSWEGAEFEMATMQLSPQMAADYARLCTFFQDMKDELQGAVEKAGEGGEKGNSPMKVYWSLQQRFFRDVLNSFKVTGDGGIVSLVKQALADGHAVVVGLQSTGENCLAKLLEDGGAHLSLPHLPSAPKEAIKSFLLHHFPTTAVPKREAIETVQELEEIHKLKLAKGQPSDLAAALRDREARVAAQAEQPTEPQPCQELLDSREFFFDTLQELPIPPSPLDALIDALGGPGAVAEMTGRKGRMVRDGHNYVYKLRNAYKGEGGSAAAAAAAAQEEEAIDSVNIQERARFMKGEKLVAIISDAASTGISLHASLQPSCTNRRRRVHITLELAFSADKTLQQLGRTHRSNAASAPIYKLLSTDAGGEQRFASAVARKLLSLGALTRGDRRAASIIDFSSMNLETRHGGTALRRLVDWCKGMPEEDLEGLVEFAKEHGHVLDGVDMTDGREINAALCRALDSLELLEATNAQLQVGRFLNRLLMLPIAQQGLLSALFHTEHERVVKDAKQAGTHDEGIMDLHATRISVKGPPVTVWRDDITDTSSEALLLELDRGVPYDDALASYNDLMAEGNGEDDGEAGPAFWVSRREQYGRHNVLLAVPKLSAPHLVFVTRPNTGRSHIEMDLGELVNAYDKVEDPQDAEQYWTELYEATEDRCVHGHNCKMGSDCKMGGRKQSVRIVTGAIVPIYTALEEAIRKHRANLTKAEASLRVVRVTLTDDGTKRVGIRFPTQPEVLAALQGAIAELNSKHTAAAPPLLEPITPVDPAQLKKYQTEPKRKLAHFFQKVSKEESAAAAAAALSAPTPASGLSDDNKKKKGKGSGGSSKKKQKK